MISAIFGFSIPKLTLKSLRYRLFPHSHLRCLYFRNGPSVAMKLEARRVASNCEFPAVSYSPALIYFDKFVAVIPTAIQNMVLAIACNRPYT